MSRRWLPWAVGILTAAALLLGTPQQAQAQDKALVVRAFSSAQSNWTTFITDRLKETGLFAAVDSIDMGLSNPNPATMAQYKLVVAVSTSYGISDGAASGDAFGTYMAMRPDGAVLIYYPYTWQTGSSITPPLTGTFFANNALMTQSGTVATAATKLGNYTMGDPLTTGLQPFTCGTSCNRVTGLMPKPGATVVAYWDDGTPLAIRGKNQVALNMYGVDDSVQAGSWTQPGRQLTTNAILFLAGAILPSPASLSFPAAPLGLSSAKQTITFRNGGKTASQINQMGIDGAGAAAYSFSTVQVPSPQVPITLAPGDSFTVDVTFKPQAPGTQTAALFVNVIGLGRLSVPLTGDSRGNLLVSGAPVDFGGVPLGSMPSTKTVTLKNVGVSPISLTEVPKLANTMQYTLAPVQMPAPTYPLTLAPGSSYRFTVTFTPGMVQGKYDTAVTVKSNDVLNVLTIPVLGQTGVPGITVAYSSLVLPDTGVGSTSLPLNVLVRNPGFSDLNFVSITSDVADFKVTQPAAPVLTAGTATVFQLSFAPTMAGVRTGTITIKTNAPAPDDTKTIAVSGIGTTPQFKVDKTAIDFGSVTIGQSNTQSLKVSNDGDGDLQIKTVTLQAGMFTNSFSIGNYSSTVPANGSVQIPITCNPATAGMLTAKVTITTSLMMMGTAEVNLTCAAAGPITDVSPKTVAFGAQKILSTGSKDITVTNSGNQPVTISSVVLTQAGTEFAVMAPAANTVVMPGAPLTFKATFKPAMIGNYTASVQVNTSDPATPRFTLQLTGSGVTSSVDVSPTTLNFPPLYVGQTSTAQAVTVRNIGTTVIDKVEALPPSGMDAQDASAFRNVNLGMFKTSLMPGESTDITYAFAPRVAKDGVAAQVVIRIDGIDAAKVNLGGSALSPVLNIKPASVNFNNVIVNTTATPVEVYLTNSGTSKLSVDVADPSDEQFTLSDADGMPLTGSLTLDADQSVKLLAGFKPKALGTKRATVTLRIKGTDIELGTVSMVGEGTAAKMDSMGGCSVALGGAAAGSSTAGLLLSALSLIVLRRRRRS